MVHRKIAAGVHIRYLFKGFIAAQCEARRVSPVTLIVHLGFFHMG
jgi:hypothetical protein